jgi:putative transposase
VTHVFLYCLAVAAEKYGIVLYGWIAMSNHAHLVVRDTRGNFPEFLAWLNRMIARALNLKWGRHENFWAAEQPSAVWLATHEDAFDKLVYTVANAVRKHLVERCEEWPGATSIRQNLGEGAIELVRPSRFFSDKSKLPKHVSLRAERLPGFEDLSNAEYFAKFDRAVRHQEALARATRKKTGQRVLGRKGVLAQSHLSRPRTPSPRSDVRPHVACRDEARRKIELSALLAFRWGHKIARERYCAGDRAVVFPAGTYRMRRFGVACAPHCATTPPPTPQSRAA